MSWAKLSIENASWLSQTAILIPYAMQSVREASEQYPNCDA